MAKRIHPNFAANKLCGNCDHSHFMHAQENTQGMCLLNPPQTFFLGMAQPAIQAQRPDATNAVPILRGFYPPIGRGDTCDKWDGDASVTGDQ